MRLTFLLDKEIPGICICYASYFGKKTDIYDWLVGFKDLYSLVLYKIIFIWNITNYYKLDKIESSSPIGLWHK